MEEGKIRHESLRYVEEKKISTCDSERTKLTEMIAKKRGKKTISLPITYIELADYLSVDRCAMMREIKKLKDEKKIVTNGKKITINY